MSSSTTLTSYLYFFKRFLSSNLFTAEASKRKKSMRRRGEQYLSSQLSSILSNLDRAALYLRWVGGRIPFEGVLIFQKGPELIMFPYASKCLHLTQIEKNMKCRITGHRVLWPLYLTSVCLSWRRHYQIESKCRSRACFICLMTWCWPPRCLFGFVDYLIFW